MLLPTIESLLLSNIAVNKIISKILRRTKVINPNLDEINISEEPLEGLLQPEYENKGQTRYEIVNRTNEEKFHLNKIMRYNNSNKTTEDLQTKQNLLKPLPKRILRMLKHWAREYKVPTVKSKKKEMVFDLEI